MAIHDLPPNIVQVQVMTFLISPDTEDMLTLEKLRSAGVAFEQAIKQAVASDTNRSEHDRATLATTIYEVNQ